MKSYSFPGRSQQHPASKPFNAVETVKSYSFSRRSLHHPGKYILQCSSSTLPCPCITLPGHWLTIQAFQQPTEITKRSTPRIYLIVQEVRLGTAQSKYPLISDYYQGVSGRTAPSMVSPMPQKKTMPSYKQSSGHKNLFSPKQHTHPHTHTKHKHKEAKHLTWKSQHSPSWCRIRPVSGKPFISVQSTSSKPWTSTLRLKTLPRKAGSSLRWCSRENTARSCRPSSTMVP